MGDFGTLGGSRLTRLVFTVKIVPSMRTLVRMIDLPGRSAAT